MNLIGDLFVDSGLGEATRGILGALLAAQVPTSYSELRYAFGPTVADPPPALAWLARGNRYAVNLLIFNLHQLAGLSRERVAQLKQGKPTIAYWCWELPVVPAAFLPAFGMVDEIWTSSDYSRAILERYASCPVRTVPLPVAVTPSPSPARDHFDIPDDRFVFLFSFSVASDGGRKNPQGFLQAFAQAFPESSADGPLLVVRAQHADLLPAVRDDLQCEVERLGGRFLDGVYTRGQMDDLLACCDAYVSLHRAEGFGLGIAEAMYLAKPVIATAYSGSMDFMNAGNSFLVPYTLRLVREADRPLAPHFAEFYPAGQPWAEPSLEVAAHWMQRVAGDREASRVRGAQAAADIREHCSPAVVGRRIARLLPRYPLDPWTPLP